MKLLTKPTQVALQADQLLMAAGDAAPVVSRIGADRWLTFVIPAVCFQLIFLLNKNLFNLQMVLWEEWMNPHSPLRNSLKNLK